MRLVVGGNRYDDKDKVSEFSVSDRLGFVVLQGICRIIGRPEEPYVQ
jgi:hypothetical protein